jgi:hypothetical protein
MPHVNRWIALALTLAALPLSACQAASEEEAAGENEPAKVEPLEGTNLSRLTLTAKAAERLDIQTAPVREAGARTVIPYSAVVYDPNGETWTYTNPARRTFVRQSIVIDRIEGDQAFLLDGPPPGTAVVTVGVAELYGTELGVE